MHYPGFSLRSNPSGLKLANAFGVMRGAGINQSAFGVMRGLASTKVPSGVMRGVELTEAALYNPYD
jgi:hypothetical protein